MNESPQLAIAPETFRRVSFDLENGSVAGIVFGAEAASPDIVFLHATGFNARTYRMLLQPLGERFSVLALDLRGDERLFLRRCSVTHPGGAIATMC